MKVKSIFSVVAILAIWAVLIQGVATTDVFALGYQSSVDLEFTFEPVLAISLSSADLLISNLAPGASAYSNTISVNVSTNNIAGYTLSAKVGDGNTYTNDKLTNASSSTVFDNLSSSSNLTLSQFNDNVWGYALGTIDSNTTYSGLVYNTDTVINATTNNTGTAASSGCVSTCSGTNNTNFTIAAKASSTQVSGDYSNVIIFTVVGNVPPAPKTISDLDYMQDFNSLTASEKTEVLTSMTEGQSYPLLDKRDNKTYRIAKLADGNAWMLDNLALDIVEVSLTKLKGNTNASDTTLEYLKGTHVRGDGNITGDTNYPTAGVGYSNTNNYYNIPKIAISGDCYDAYCVNDPASGKWTSDSITQATINGTTSIAQGKIGIYYNFCAASAGSYCYGSGTSSTGSPESDPDSTTIRDVTEDICPSGWRLPTTSYSGGDFPALYAQYNSDYSTFQAAFSTALSGYFSGGKAFYQGNYSRFWSSTWDDNTHMGYLSLSSSYASPTGSNVRYFGDSVRCILGS